MPIARQWYERSLALAPEDLIAAIENEELVAYYQQKLAQNPPNDVLWAIVSGLRDKNESREAKALLTQLGQHPDPDIANAARDALTD